MSHNTLSFSQEELEPKRDGFDHINIYSKGKTELGKALTNFAKSYFTYPNAGDFASVEGFWYWLRCAMLPVPWTAEEKERIKKLRQLHGHDAKTHGKGLLDGVAKSYLDNINEEHFKEGIREAVKQKLIGNPRLCKLMVNSSLPFKHYYWYGNEENPNIRPGGHQWLIETLERYRLDLKVQASHCILYRLYTNGDELPHAFVDLSDARLENIDTFSSHLDGLSGTTVEGILEWLPRFQDGWDDERYRGFVETTFFHKVNDGYVPHTFYKVVILEASGQTIKEL